MRRRDIPKALFASAAASVPSHPATAAELGARVDALEAGYNSAPIANARRFGFSASATAAVNSSAIAAAAMSLGNGGTVHLPAGEFTVDSATVPPSVVIRGVGKRATRLIYPGRGTFLCLGGQNAELSYGCGFSDCAIVLSHPAAEAVRVQGCAGAEVQRLYIEGQLVAGRTNSGVVVDGGNASSFFNNVEDVQCNHMQNAFKMVTTGKRNCTQTLFKNCDALGDVSGIGSMSIGFAVDAHQGNGSIWIGGNFESCGKGVLVKSKAQSVTVVGARFEGNRTDVECQPESDAWSFFGCAGLDPAKINDYSHVAHQRHNFIGCTTVNGLPFGNKLVGNNSLRSAVSTDIPLVVETYPGLTTGDAIRLRNSSGAVLFAANVLGQITKLCAFNVLITAGIGNPEGVVIAGPGSVYLNTGGGPGRTLYVKESGAGSTGWIEK